MSAKQLKTAAHQTLRVGEGHAVEVAILPATKGELGQYSLDISSLPVPDRKLACDTVSIVKLDYMVKLLFAQKDAIGSGYLSALVVQMTHESVNNFLRVTTTLEAGIKELENKGFPRGSLVEIKDKPEQSAVVTASMIMAGYSGLDGCLDFYYASPFSVAAINYGNKLSVEAVVRVNLPTPLLVAMCRGLGEIKLTLPSQAGGVKS